MTTDTPQAEWDKRSEFNILWAKYMDKVLASDQSNPREWFENLHDYYDFVSAPLTKNKYYETELLNIYKLIFNKKNLTSKEYAHNLEQSYWRMRKLVREMNKELYEAGHLLPLSRPRDVKRAIDNYYEI